MLSTTLEDFELLTNVPQSSAEALAFLKEITDDEHGGLIYDDELQVYSLNNDLENIDSIGTLKTSISFGIKLRSELFGIKTQLRIENLEEKHRCDIVSYVDNRLILIEQKCDETIKKFHERKKTLDILIDKQLYLFIKSVTMDGKLHENSMFSVRPTSMHGFISSGSNILLLKKLAVKKHIPDNFKLITLDPMSKIICNTTFEELGFFKIETNMGQSEVMGIEQKYFMPNDKIAIYRYFLDRFGQMMLFLDFPLNYLLKNDYVINVDQIKELFSLGKGIPPYEWEASFYFMSKFQNIKNEKKSNINMYLRNHPEVKHLITDFLQKVLIEKPDNPTEFAINYFNK